MLQTIVIIIAAAAAVSQAQTEMGKVASQMAARTWRPVSTTGITGDLFKTGPVMDDIFAYSDDAKWDPVSRQILFLGCPHYAPWRFPVYKEETNAWRAEALPTSSMVPGGDVYIDHAYDNNAVDAGGNFYNFGAHGSMFRFNTASNSWTTLSQGGSKPDVGFGMALEYFPELGGLVHVFNGTISLFNLGSNAWSTLRTGVAMGGYHNIAEYDPVHHVMILGGGNGSNAIHRLDAQGNLTSFRPPPVTLGIPTSVITCDPVTGRFLVMSENAFYAFDAVADAWELLYADIRTAPGLSTFTNVPRVAASISTYGVVAYISNYMYAVLLYKYAASSAADTRPALSAGAGLEIYPNPAKLDSKVHFRLDNAANGEYLIYDARGRCVARVAQAVWDTSRLTPGIYTVKARQGDRFFTAKLALMN